MRQIDIDNHLRRRLFLPFELVTTIQITYTVRHPEQAMTTRSSVLLAPETNPITGVEFDVTLSLLHVVFIQPFRGSPSPGANGPATA